MRSLDAKLSRRSVLAGGLALFVAPLAAEAQPAGRVSRIGVLLFEASTPASIPNAPLEALLRGLREVGLAPGRNVVLELRYAEGRPERFPAFAAELLNLKVDVIVAARTPGVSAARQATTTIPIVMVAVSDPVGSKLVESLARPGGNVTGLSLLAPELSAKRLDLLNQTVPKLARVTVLWNSANQGMLLRFREAQAAARVLGVGLQSVAVQGPDDFEPAFAAMTKDRPQALLVMADTVTVANRVRTVEFAERNRVPAIYEVREFVDAGGLMAYGISLPDQFRRAAGYVDKILKGARPADLPVEQPTKFELVINMKTAKALGLRIPQSLLVRADEVIE